jgi:gluconate transporter
LAHGPYLVLITIIAIGLLLGLILYARMHAFLALLVTSMALGLAAGMPPLKLLHSIQAGVGDALSFIAVVVALGAMIGRYLEYCGGGRELARWLLDRLGPARAHWASLCAGFLVGLPIFFEVGFIILAPLTWSFGRESKRSLLFFAMPIAAALTIVHSLVPPHPAPSVAAQLLGADIGRTILYGIAISIPTMIVSGIWYGVWISKRISPPIPSFAAKVDTEKLGDRKPPAVGLVILILLMPILLIFAATIANMRNWPGRPVLEFIGHPFTALLLTVMAAAYFFAFRRGVNGEQITKLATESLAPTASLLLIIAGGGALKQVIVDSGVAPYAGHALAATSLSPLLIAFIIATALRAALGSATVAIVTASGILAPMMKQFGAVSPELLVMAVCCGGTSISHVNDAGFWIVKEYLGMTVTETLKSWTVMKIIEAVLGMAIVLLLATFIR